MSDINENVWLTVPEVAQLMNVEESVVLHWGKTGHFGARKTGRGKNAEYHFEQSRLDMLSVDDVAEWLNLNVQTVRRWAREGLYPTIKLGRRYYFSRKVLTAGLHEAADA